LDSRDTRLMARALETLGARVDTADDGAWSVDPIRLPGADGASGGETGADPLTVDCGLAGTVMRFLPPVAALLGRPVRFDGDEQARVRPMAPVLRALTALGARIDGDGARTHTLPFTLTAPPGL